MNEFTENVLFENVYLRTYAYTLKMLGTGNIIFQKKCKVSFVGEFICSVDTLVLVLNF